MSRFCFIGPLCLRVALSVQPLCERRISSQTGEDSSHFQVSLHFVAFFFIVWSVETFSFLFFFPLFFR